MQIRQIYIEPCIVRVKIKWWFNTLPGAESSVHIMWDEEMCMNTWFHRGRLANPLSNACPQNIQVCKSQFSCWKTKPARLWVCESLNQRFQKAWIFRKGNKCLMLPNLAFKTASFQLYDEWSCNPLTHCMHCLGRVTSNHVSPKCFGLLMTCI